jgi:SAM-dependent methyltransferase
VDHCHAGWARYLDELWSLDPTPVRTVLDLCCGTGLTTAELVALGYQVVGVDRSAAMLARARHLLGADTVLEKQTLPDLTIHGTFDAAVCTFDGLNYLTPTGLRATFAAVARRLRPDGWLSFDLHTDETMHFIRRNPIAEGEAHGQHYTLSSLVDVVARTCDTRIDVTRAGGGDTFREKHRQYFHPDGYVRKALLDTGFGMAAVTDEYSHRSPDRSTLRATWIVRCRPT